MARWFALPTLDPASDMRLAVDDGRRARSATPTSAVRTDGGPKAYDRPAHGAVTQTRCELLVRLGRGSRRRARRRRRRGAVLRRREGHGAPGGCLPAAGYAIIRSSYEMERALEGELEPPVWPAGLDPRAFAVERRRGGVSRLRRRHSPTTGASRRATFETWQRLQPRRERGSRPSGGSSGTATRSRASASTGPARRGHDGRAGSASLAVRRPWRRRGLGEALLRDVVPPFAERGKRSRRARRRCREHDGRRRPLRAGRHACRAAVRHVGADRVSTLRARCPDCRTLTAVAIDDEYQCHSCGREFAAGLVRVPRAWGAGGEAMAEAAPAPAAVSGGGGDRGDIARRSDRGADAATSPRARSFSAAAAARMSARSAASRRARGPARGRLDRCPRRPQHARELAVRQRVGDAAADGDRRRRGRSRRRRARRRAEPRSARARLSRGERASTTTSTGRSTAATASTSRFDCDVLRPGELAVLHARARRADARRGRGAASGRRRALPVAGLGLTGSAAQAPTRPPSSRLAAAAGL